MAISNQLIVSFDYPLINKYYDFFLISTSDKYIKSGAYLLDKPIDELKAESVVFDNGRYLFIMFKHGIISKFDLIRELIDEKLTIKQIPSEDIKDYILFRLFLYSINNFDSEENKFNNLAGKLYITQPKWIAKNYKTFKALNINVDQELHLTAEATTFTRTDCFTNKNILKDYPRYSFSNKNFSLKRCLDKELDNTYIRKSLFGKKAEIVYFDFSKNEIMNNKVFYIYKVLDLLSAKFSKFLSFDFKKINVAKSIGKMRDNDFIEKSYQMLKNKQINIINWSNATEYDDEFNDIVSALCNRGLNVIKTNHLSKDSFNLVYLHNKEFYEQNKYKDPYSKFNNDIVCQHITIEDTAEKIVDDNDAIINTLIKEYVIKDDIVNKQKISLDNWSALNYSGSLVFAKEENGVIYLLNVSPDGAISFLKKSNDFSSFKNKLYDKCADYLTDNKSNDKSLIADDNGNIIVISRTNKFILPSKELLTLTSISRSKESRDTYLNGVVDINLYNEGEDQFYNVGIKGSGMNTKIVRTSPIYKVDVIEGENFIESILETMAVPFVKYKNFTVMPYPFKYLNEYIEMNERGHKE